MPVLGEAICMASGEVSVLHKFILKRRSINRHRDKRSNWNQRKLNLLHNNPLMQ